MNIDSIDIRWVQRFNNFKKALSQLSKFVQKQELNELEQLGLIQSFEYTHELAWNTLKDFLENKGSKSIFGSKDATREAFRFGIIEDGETWVDMIQSRNLSTHTYNEDTANEICDKISHNYISCFLSLQKKLEDLTKV